MKKGITIILLLVTVMYIFGLYGVYVCHTYTVKQNMRDAINAGLFTSKEVITLSISLEGLTAAEADRWHQQEIAYQGNMYDVVNIRQQAGTLMIQCICDDDENELIAFFQHTLQKHRRAPGKGTNALQSLFSPFLLTNGLQCPAGSPQASARQHLQILVAGMSRGFTYTPAPPPWLV